MSIDEERFGQAMTAALDGPEREGVEFRNHELHIRPIARQRAQPRLARALASAVTAAQSMCQEAASATVRSR